MESLKQNMLRATLVACLLAPFLTLATGGPGRALAKTGATEMAIGLEGAGAASQCGSVALTEVRSNPSMMLLSRFTKEMSVTAFRKYTCADSMRAAMGGNDLEHPVVLNDATDDDSPVCIGPVGMAVSGSLQDPAKDLPPSSLLPYTAYLIARAGDRVDRRIAWGFNFIIWAATLASLSSMAYTDVGKSIFSKSHSRRCSKADTWIHQRRQSRSAGFLLS